MCGISYQFQQERLKCVMIKICKGENKETIVWVCFVEKVFLKISQNSQENTCVRASPY